MKTKYAPQYAAGGDLALVDFIRGGADFRTGSWQGYEGVNLEAIIDLGEVQNIGTISAGFLQDQGSWIFMPVKVEFYLSSDGKEYTKTTSVDNNISEHESGSARKDFSAEFKGKNARYVKVIAINRGTCPDWHPGAGSKAWIFADEILIE